MKHGGEKQAFVKQIKGPFGKAVVEIGYNYKKLKDSGKQKGGKPIWKL